MGKIFDNSVIDARRENTKEKAARFDAAERERLEIGRASCRERV